MGRYPDRGLHGRVVDELGSQIVRGELAIGDSVDTDAVSATFDVSRTVVREAFKVLAGKGLIDARPRRGTYVRERTNWNLLDPDVLRWHFDAGPNRLMLDKLQELRVLVEPGAAELAAQRRNPGDIARILAAVEGMSVNGATPAEIADHDLEFHLGIIAAAHNELIEQLSILIGIGLSARDQFVHSHDVSIARSLPMHRDVAHAVRDGNSRDARARMLDLLEGAARDLLEVVEPERSTNR